MSISKNLIRKMEKRIFMESGIIVIPLMSSPEQMEALRQEAKKQGKIAVGLPLEIATKYGLNTGNLS